MLVLGAIAIGCGDYKLDLGSDDPAETVPNRTRPQLWTLFDMARASAEGRPIAQSTSFPDGFPPDTFLQPRGDGLTELKIIPAFSEGEPAAYVVPEIWVDFDEVWVQPWYVFLTAWDNRGTGANRLRDPDGNSAPPVFDVHPKSLFYNPFWLIFYAVVPEGTPTDKYKNAEQIFNDKLPIYPGPPWIYSVRPPQVVLPSPAWHPYMKKPVATFLRSFELSWVDNEAMPYFDEGVNNFKYDPKTLVLAEVPLFLLAQRDEQGNEVIMSEAAHVIGTGPILSRTPPDAPGGRPKFGSLTRFHVAVAGATAKAFIGAQNPAAVELLQTKKLDPTAYEGRVAANGGVVAANDRSCFASPDFPTACRWLDSQNAIEDQLGVINLRRTEVLACSPVVFYGGKGIGR